MKKYLLTWYGITDLRASAGLEKSAGPILSALQAEEYSEVIILGYTAPEKINNAENSDTVDVRKQLENARSAGPDALERCFQTFVNTKAAHAHFVAWLQQELQNSGIPSRIRFYPVQLQHLNDTEGIYAAATEALSRVSKEDGGKTVTLFLSPGTPVMAFVWAFASLGFPSLQQRLIASPQPGKPPADIALPQEWLEWHGMRVNATGSDDKEFDIVFHLFGEQRMPSLLGILQFPSKRHVFVNSKDYPARRAMERFVGNAEFGELLVDPFDPKGVRRKILAVTDRMPQNFRIGFNLTGGTKLMYAGALAACRKLNATPFYFDVKNHKVVFLNDFRTEDVRKIDSIETFIKLRGEDLYISKPGFFSDIPDIDMPGRKELTNLLWQERFDIAKLYYKLEKYVPMPSEPFDIPEGSICAKLLKNGTAEITINEKHFSFTKWPDFAKYLCGGWFEEYTYRRLLPFQTRKLIKDLRIGLEISITNNPDDIKDKNFNQYNEFDIVFTDGYRLYIVECKAGKVTSEHVMKLQNITNSFGGVEGRGILASCFRPYIPAANKKIEHTKNISSVYGNTLFKRIEAILQSSGK